MTYFGTGDFEDSDSYSQAELSYMQEFAESLRDFFQKNPGAPLPPDMVFEEDRTALTKEQKDREDLRRLVVNEMWHRLEISPVFPEA